MRAFLLSMKCPPELRGIDVTQGRYIPLLQWVESMATVQLLKYGTYSTFTLLDHYFSGANTALFLKLHIQLSDSFS